MGADHYQNPDVEIGDIDGNGRTDVFFPVRGQALLNIPSVNAPGTLSLSVDVQLTARVADADGAGQYPPYANYAWQRSDGSGGYTAIAGATNDQYQVSAADSGHDLRAVARYADGTLTIENVTSSPIHVVAGSAAGQTLVATGSDDFIFALGDVSSADFSQRNTAVFATSVRLENTVTQTNSATETVVGPGGHDSLVHVGNFAFLDGTLSFDQNGSAAVVTRLYDATLGRDPDSAGLSHFTTALEHGASVRDVAAALTASSEFQAYEGALDNSGFVGAVYGGVLHRNANAGEVNYWSGQLDSGVARTDVIVAIAQSSEAVSFTHAVLQSGGLFVLDEHAAQVARLYDTAFGRDPDRAGLEYWRGFLDQGGPGHTLGDVANAFAGSPEFTARYGQASTDAYVTALYQNTLHRAPDDAGRAHWDAILDGAAETRAQVALDFSESPEHQSLLASHIRDGIHLV